MADEKKMSVEDILAACRSDGGEAAEEETTAEPISASSAADKPAGKPSGEMSPADILAAARSQGEAGGEAAQPKKVVAAARGKKKPGEMTAADILAAARASRDTGKKPQPKPAAGKAKPAAKTPQGAAAKGPAAPRDTSSVLAAARKAVKPGPMSKAEAAAKGKEIPAAKQRAPAMPEKPSFAKPTPRAKASSVDESRRGFLAAIGNMMNVIVGSFLAVGFTSLAAVGGIWAAGTARFMFPNVLIEPPKRFKVGYPADFAPGTVTTTFKAQYGVWIVNAEYEGEAMITALKSVCTHLGCTPNWLEGEQKFKCPCHGSGFYKDGINFEGPAPRPLERYTIRIADDGQLEVDKSRIYQQEMGQWNDTSSFVPV